MKGEGFSFLSTEPETRPMRDRIRERGDRINVNAVATPVTAQTVG
ncbi:MAG: hypothetical protein PUI25_05475 [Spirochaetales bacterium]|nr:hypothetical protein [Spirochaetales bacterium]